MSWGVLIVTVLLEVALYALLRLRQTQDLARVGGVLKLAHAPVTGARAVNRSAVNLEPARHFSLPQGR